MNDTMTSSPPKFIFSVIGVAPYWPNMLCCVCVFLNRTLNERNWTRNGHLLTNFSYVGQSAFHNQTFLFTRKCSSFAFSTLRNVLFQMLRRFAFSQNMLCIFSPASSPSSLFSTSSPSSPLRSLSALLLSLCCWCCLVVVSWWSVFGWLEPAGALHERQISIPTCASTSTASAPQAPWWAPRHHPSLLL